MNPFHLSARIPQCFDPQPPGLLPKIVGGQKSTRQQRIVRHGVQPRVALLRRPAQHCLRRCFVPNHIARPFLERFEMPGVAAIDAFEVPRAADNFRIRLSRAGARLEQDQGFHVDFPAAENLLFFIERIRRNSHTVLQVSVAIVAQVASQSFALGVLSRRQVEEHHPPFSVPNTRPTLLRVAPARHMQSPLHRQPVQAVVSGAFNQLLALQSGELTQKAVAIGQLS